MRRHLLLVGVAGTLTGCFGAKINGGPTECFNDFCPAANELVAVLPFANETVDMDGPVVLREAFVEAGKKRGLNVMPVEQSDTILRDNGITQGGQLKAVDPPTLKDILKCQYAFYGNVQVFSSKNAMIRVSRQVKADFRLVYLPEGREIWKADHAEKRVEWHLSGKLDADGMRANMARGLVSGLLKSPLRKESRLVAKKSLSTLPQFTGPGPAVGREPPAEEPAEPAEPAAPARAPASESNDAALAGM
jgi:hypothetical protein